MNSWRSEVQSQEAKLKNLHDRLRELRAHDWTLRRLDPDAAAENLLKDLESAMSAAGVEMPPTPEADHEELLERALDRRQPFDSKGSGYRDALLWQIVRDYASGGNEVVLVSNDCTAFAEGRKKGAGLAAVLVEELPAGQVALVSNAHAAIEHLGLSQDDALAAVEATIRRLQPNLGELLLDWLAEELPGPAEKWNARELVNPFTAVGVALGVAYEALSINVDEARQMEDGPLEAVVTLRVRQFVTVYIPTGLDSHFDRLGRVAHVDDEVVGREVDADIGHHIRVVLDPVNDRLISAAVIDTIYIRH